MKAVKHSMNQLTRAITAFSSWEKFAAAMESGYVPTLRKLTECSRSSAQTREYNEQVEELTERLESLGYRVWRG